MEIQLAVFCFFFPVDFRRMVTVCEIHSSPCFPDFNTVKVKQNKVIRILSVCDPLFRVTDCDNMSQTNTSPSHNNHHGLRQKTPPVTTNNYTTVIRKKCIEWI